MSIVAVFSPMMYDDEDQGGSLNPSIPDNVAMQEISALGAGVANNAITDRPTAIAGLANGVTGVAYAPTVTTV